MVMKVTVREVKKIKGCPHGDKTPNSDVGHYAG
jgi:hypothetical protein